jgi:hypothetical protein
MRYLRWILFRIFHCDPKANVIVAGDFNRIAMEYTEFLVKDYYL